MKPSLGLNLSQNLVITPQLQQAIYLLQLSTLDLQQEIQQALESNPLLELEETDQAIPAVEPDPFDTSTREANKAEAQQEATATEMNQWEEQRLPEELAVDTAWEDVYSHDYSPPSGHQDNFQDNYERDTASTSLIDHLLWQLNLSLHNERDRIIGETLIDSINPEGYLSEDPQVICDSLQSQDEEFSDLTCEEVLALLKLIQRFDPPGVGARDLRECLLLQLEQLPEDTPYLPQARRLVDQYLEILAGRDYRFLMRRLKLKHEDELHEIITLIQQLNPRPGSSIESETSSYVIPDLLVTRTQQGWRVELNPETLPKLRVQPQYADLIRRADSSDTNQYLKDHFREAQWLIKSLQSRSETLLKVGSKIVEVQQDFLEKGEEFMKPMVLADIATAIEMHESTVSRATTQKYIHTPRGLFELKYFFSSHVSTAEGGEASSTAIRAMLKKLISNEPPKKPLSDSKLADLLADSGIQIARRTVAKYREALGIPPSSERKRLR
ncbi:RNA polymerase factor sigma-54 [Marinospirillum sp.]|uniref:RNA polymerase factor sigma-54 n=1 Tax=Marinospirillum sp. TaxID=2183934 RepID=UPI0028707A55|nr:RNA polymerase factor sigma-54 [Marinospirillum sp.]MDR9467344.1 RNA polymerase factor sigma-54 [Marinospirillum sp.]